MVQRWDKLRGGLTGGIRSGWSRTVRFVSAQFSRGRVNRLQALFPALETGPIDLHSSARILEQRFLAIGKDLEHSTQLSNALVARGESLVNLAVGKAEGEAELHCAVEVLNNPLGFLDEFQTYSGGLITSLRECEAALQIVCQLRPVMESAVVPLKFVQTLFRVESAALKAEEYAMFIGLAQDIEHLHNQVAQTLEEQFHNLETARAVILKLITRLQLQVDDHHRFVAEKKNAVQQSLANLRRILEASQKRDFNFRQTTQVVNEHITRAVVYLQFQDITRQKLQHVESALEKLRARCGELPRASRKQANELLCDFHEVARVQVSQIAAILQDLTEAEAEIRGALASIAQDAGRLDDKCLALQGLDGNSAAEDGMVQVLLDVTNEIRNLMLSTVNMQAEVYEAIRPLSGLAANFTGGLRQLSSNIRLIALNAQVHAAQIGSGTGLEVLSERTCNISDEANAVNDQAASQLHALVSALERIVTECGSLSQRANVQLEWLNSEGQHLEQRLHAYRDRTLAVFQEVGGLAKQLREQLDQALHDAEFAAAADEHLDRVRTALQAVVDETRQAHDDQSVKQPSRAAELPDHYTMASEREVHLAALKSNSPAVAPSRGEPVLAGAKPTSDDNVELF